MIYKKTNSKFLSLKLVIEKEWRADKIPSVHIATLSWLLSAAEHQPIYWKQT
ncbi:MAG: hypothetical protein U9P81_03415 [Euryarchaeota archaeon]|nr:hypothetical protein [Euryarchaeota archaeon]